MAPNPFRTKEFKRLRREWYARLKSEGFHDAEAQRGDTELLKTWESLRFQLYYTPEQFMAKQFYYAVAGQFLHAHRFGSTTERAAWALHAEGFGDRAISIVLHINRKQTQKILKHLRKLLFEYAKASRE